jgi:hypothetical protein
MVIAAYFVASCSQGNYSYEAIQEQEILEDQSLGLEVADFSNWLKSQEIERGLIEEKELNWDNVEIKLMPDGKSKKISFLIYQGTNSLGNDSIRELHIAYVRNRFMGGVMVFSFHHKECARYMYYDLSGQLSEEGEYYAPKQIYMALNPYSTPYSVEWAKVRLKSGSEGETEGETDCENIVIVNGTKTPLRINGKLNPAAYNCHTHVWGPPAPGPAPCYNDSISQWNYCPDIAGSGWSEVSTPQVGDRWVSFKDDPTFGENAAWHSAKVLEVIDDKVTRVEAKMGDNEILYYNPDCTTEYFRYYKTDNIKYYRQL